MGDGGRVHERARCIMGRWLAGGQGGNHVCLALMIREVAWPHPAWPSPVSPERCQVVGEPACIGILTARHTKASVFLAYLLSPAAHPRSAPSSAIPVNTQRPKIQQGGPSLPPINPPPYLLANLCHSETRYTARLRLYSRHPGNSQQVCAATERGGRPGLLVGLPHTPDPPLQLWALAHESHCTRCCQSRLERRAGGGACMPFPGPAAHRPEQGEEIKAPG